MLINVTGGFFGVVKNSGFREFSMKQREEASHNFCRKISILQKLRLLSKTARLIEKKIEMYRKMNRFEGIRSDLRQRKASHCYHRPLLQLGESTSFTVVSLASFCYRLQHLWMK